MSLDAYARIARALDLRFGASIPVATGQPGADDLARLLEHNTHRRFASEAVPADLLRLLFAAALSSPSKSDLQQAGVVWVRDPARRTAVADLVPSMPWLKDAPELLVFVGDNRRIRNIAGLRGHPFANDHLDSFFNAAVDAGIVLGTFVHAAESAGLASCAISGLRNRSAELGAILELPKWVFPVAGLAVGRPLLGGRIVPRLPLEANVHVDRYDDAGLAEKIDAYDRRRAALQPYAEQQDVERFGAAEFYGWSEDKARQYATPARADFGAYIRSQGFNLD